jgi:hypothetical protein
MFASLTAVSIARAQGVRAFHAGATLAMAKGTVKWFDVKKCVSESLSDSI